MNAKSFNGKTINDISQKLTNSLEDGFKPTLAFIFLSVSLDRKGIQKLFSSHNIQIFGVTTNGEFIDENLEKGSASILLLDMNTRLFSNSFSTI